jgi:hypothetical protein
VNAKEAIPSDAPVKEIVFTDKPQNAIKAPVGAVTSTPLPKFFTVATTLVPGAPLCGTSVIATTRARIASAAWNVKVCGSPVTMTVILREPAATEFAAIVAVPVYTVAVTTQATPATATPSMKTMSRDVLKLAYGTVTDRERATAVSMYADNGVTVPSDGGVACTIPNASVFVKADIPPIPVLHLSDIATGIEPAVPTRTGTMNETTIRPVKLDTENGTDVPFIRTTAALVLTNPANINCARTHDRCERD